MARKRNPPDEPATPEVPAAAPAAPTAEAADSGPMVTILKTAVAPKLSPRGDGELTFQVGRMGDAVLLRIHHNASAGRFSKEWVGVAAIRAALAKLPKGTETFKGALVLRPAWKGQSACNSGFGAAAARAEGIFIADPEKKGMLRLAAPDALDAWERAMLALPVPKDAEQVPLNPPKPQPFFKKKADTDGAAAVANSGAPADVAGESAADADTAETEAPGEGAGAEE